VAPPINEWSKEELAVFGLHHVVYTVVAGLVFDAINQNEKDTEVISIAKKQSSLSKNIK